MATEYKEPDLNYGSRISGSIKQDPYTIVSVPSVTKSKYIEQYVDEYGIISNNHEGKKLKDVQYKDDSTDHFAYTEVRYPAVPFSDPGMFNGFPFLLQEDNEFLNIPSNDIEIEDIGSYTARGGMSVRSLTGIPVDTSEFEDRPPSTLGGGFPLGQRRNYFQTSQFWQQREIVSKNFYNLAAIETEFVIETKAAPNVYETGVARDPANYRTMDRYHPRQLITCDFEVVDQYHDLEHPPHHRQYRSETGIVSNHGNLDENNLLTGMASNYSSIFIHGSDTENRVEMYTPITIQPSNTGAFVITTDEGVAEYFENLSTYGPKKAFNVNYIFDYNTNQYDHEGFNRCPVEYNSFPAKAYIVPATNWDFEVSASKIKAIYYQYNLDTEARILGDQSSFRDKMFNESDTTSLFFAHSSHLPLNWGGMKLTYNNLPLTHMPFESAHGRTHAGRFDVVFSSFYKLNPGTTALVPTALDLTPAQTKKYRQYYEGRGNYDMGGTYDQRGKKFYVYRDRFVSALDTTTIQRYYPKKNRIDINDDFRSKIVPVRDFANAFNPNYKPKMLNFKNLGPDQNVRKQMNHDNESIDIYSSVSSDRVIKVKTKNYTSLKNEFYEVGSAGKIRVIEGRNVTVSDIKNPN